MCESLYSSTQIGAKGCEPLGKYDFFSAPLGTCCHLQNATIDTTADTTSVACNSPGCSFSIYVASSSSAGLPIAHGSSTETLVQRQTNPIKHYANTQTFEMHRWWIQRGERRDHLCLGALDLPAVGKVGALISSGLSVGRLWLNSSSLPSMGASRGFSNCSRWKWRLEATRSGLMLVFPNNVMQLLKAEAMKGIFPHPINS